MRSCRGVYYRLDWRNVGGDYFTAGGDMSLSGKILVVDIVVRLDIARPDWTFLVGAGKFVARGSGYGSATEAKDAAEYQLQRVIDGEVDPWAIGANEAERKLLKARRERDNVLPEDDYAF